MTPIDWATRPLKKYADFSGRAPRAEYWWFMLLNVVVSLIARTVDSILGLGPVILVYGPVTLLSSLTFFVPALAVGVRRLHDTNRSGWWWLIILIPLIGAITLIIFFVMQGIAGSNQYGDDPHADSGESLATA